MCLFITHTHKKAGLHVNRSEKDMYVINNVKKNMLFGYPNKKAIMIVMCNTIVEWPHLQRVSLLASVGKLRRGGEFLQGPTSRQRTTGN